ncbi:MAG: hypothetical protein A2Z20_04165 [Bdellovibrionales bacterium RBG_16_40_8]|nr:MAG: hypothetical protein A2Z20_04165 [Bdellovibrionales bacterium RBG_16_40_8]
MCDKYQRKKMGFIQMTVMQFEYTVGGMLRMPNHGIAGRIDGSQMADFSQLITLGNNQLPSF